LPRNQVLPTAGRITARSSPRPAFIKEGQFEHLHIRTGNSTRLLTTKEAIDYCKTRWKAQ
jgi:hypothetical protein